MTKKTGKYIISSVAGEKVKAFLPNPLPPQPLELSSRLHRLNEQANRALGRLDMATAQLPDLGHFLYFYVRKEALLSSQIEGTQSSFADLLLFESEETPSVSLDDVQEVSNYVTAIEYGMKRIRDDDFPVSVRLLKEIHSILLRKGRGESKSPGKFRRSQNRIGGSRPGDALFVPPPQDRVVGCMSDLEKFLHDEKRYLPILIKVGLAHVQFETIHPFLDGNGRVGRLLIPLLLCSTHVLKDPALYLSVYFKAHRDEYYRLLQDVRLKGDWENWLAFFLSGVAEVATQAAETTVELMRLFDRDRKRIDGLGRAAGSALRVHEHFQSHPIATIAGITKRLKLTYPAVKNSVGRLQKIGILKPFQTEKPRKRAVLYGYSDYLDILERGAQPL